MDAHRASCFTNAVDAAMKYVLLYGLPEKEIKLRNMRRFLRKHVTIFNFEDIADAPLSAHMCIKSCWDAIFTLLREADSFELAPLMKIKPPPKHADIHLIFDNVLYVIEVKATFKTSPDLIAFRSLRQKARRQIKSSIAHLPEEGRGYQSIDAFILYFILSETKPATMVWEKPSPPLNSQYHLKPRIVV